MERMTNDYGLVLTYEIEPTLAQLRANLKALCASLRKMGKREKWAYKAIICPSKSDKTGLIEKRTHIHLVIKANPACTASKYICKYWKERHGISSYQKISTPKSFLDDYVFPQAIYIWKQDLNPELLETYDIEQSPINASVEDVLKMTPCYIENIKNSNIHSIIDILIMDIRKVVIKVSGWINIEKITGTKAERPQLDKMLEQLRNDDTVIITELTRLSRSTKDLFSLVEKIEDKGADIKSLKESWLDTTTPQGKLMFTIFAGISQFDRDLISQRTLEGLESARARGRKGGRPKKQNDKIELAFKMYDDKKYSIAEITEATGISKPTLYRYIRERK